MARCQKVITTTGTVTAQLMGGGTASEFYGLSAVSAEAAAFYVKLFWEGTGTAPATTAGGLQPATTTPAAGSAVSAITFLVPTTGIALSVVNVPINNGGRIWYWVSATAADGAQTVLTTGGDIITFVYD